MQSPMTKTLLALTALALALALTAAPGMASAEAEAEAAQKKDRAFSLFTIVNFPNDQCTTQDDSTLYGTCYSSTECSDKGGEEDGNCASGFGVCCLFKLSTCGGTVDQNCTYIQNPSYPSSYAITAATTCTYSVSPAYENICQLRLDFDNFVLASAPVATGLCGDTFVATGPTGRNPPTICGTNTGLHMYVETASSSTATTLVFTMDGTTSATRTYRVKVSQIPCESKYKAPNDCVQYFTGTSGTTTTYAFASGTMLQSQAYMSCVRREMGNCYIQWTTTSITSPDPFGLGVVSATTTAANAPTSCTTNYVLIPTAALAVPKFCGGNLNTNGIATAANTPTISSVITSTGVPFKIYTFSGAVSLLAPATGYSLQWAQVPC